jgi:type II secretory pathway pseudopilin PulG
MKNTSNIKGFTLVELIVVMAIFMVVIIISTSAFENILKSSGQQGKAAESEISGIVGLAMMRADIAAAGYGLPWVFQATPAAYKEVDDNNLPTSNVLSDVKFNNLRDIPPDLPKAIVSTTGSSAGYSGVDYLVIKGSVLGMNKSARKWNFVNYSSSNQSHLSLRNDSSTDLANGDRAITIASTFTPTGAESKQLVVDTLNGNAFYYSVPNIASPAPGPIPGTAYQPIDKTQVFVAYGIKDSNLRMPYNRVDFYVDKSATKPVSCNSGTGVLYKAVADHQGGSNKYPLLDCVGDMQVTYERDQNNDGNITQIDESVIGTMSSDEIRTQIKNVRVHILAQEGKKDLNFTYPVSDVNNVICVGPYSGNQCSSVGRSWTQSSLQNVFGADWQNFRWKVYYFVVNLKNLQQ